MRIYDYSTGNSKNIKRRNVENKDGDPKRKLV